MNQEKNTLNQIEQEIATNKQQISNIQNNILHYNNQLEKIKHYKITHPLSYSTANFFSSSSPKKQFQRMILIGIILTTINVLIGYQLPLPIFTQNLTIAASTILINVILYLSFNYLSKQVGTTFQMQVAEQFIKEELIKLSQELERNIIKQTQLQATYQLMHKEQNNHQHPIAPVNHDYELIIPKKHIKK